MFSKTKYGNAKKEWEDMKLFIEKNKIHNFFIMAECLNDNRTMKVFAHGSVQSIKGMVQDWLDNYERETLVRRQVEESMKMQNKIREDYKKDFEEMKKNA